MFGVRSDIIPPVIPANASLHERIALLLDFIERRDPLGHRVQTWLAMAFAFTLPLSTAGASIASAALFIHAVVRLPNTWRCYAPLLLSPVLWACAVFTMWMAASLMWSIDIEQGVDEIGAARMLATPLILWPVVREIPRIVLAAIIGVFAANVVQLLQLLDVVPVRKEDRLSGWLHPIQTGGWCAAAVCWWISAILHGRGGARWIALFGAAAAGLGLIGTGSRGPWIAAAIAVPLCVVFIGLRRRDVRKPAVVLCATGVLAIGGVWLFARGPITQRIDDALTEIHDATDREIYWTSTGLRIAQTDWSLELFAQKPIVGWGAGSYQSATDALASFQSATDAARASSKNEKTSEKRAEYLRRHHPHSTYALTLACQGAIGGLLLAAMLITALVGAWRAPPNHLFRDGTFCVLIVWVIGAQFDCWHLNGHLYGLFALAVTVTLPHGHSTKTE